MEFEFDPAKSASNQEKHGLDFVDAQRMWLDPMLVEIPARTTNEPRFVVIAKIAGKHWTGVVTYRESLIRIISVRRSRKEEFEIYESP